MINREFSSLAPRISPNTPGCPQPLIIQAVRNAAIRTCERTLGWRHAEPPYELQPGVHEYLYRKPAGSDVHAVFGASINGYPLNHLPLDAALQQYPSWADLYSGVPFEDLWTASGSFNEAAYNEQLLNGGATFAMTDAAMEAASEPRAITQLTPDKYIVLPLPDNTKTYELRLIYALKPKREATGLPDNIFDELEDAIFHGAMQELMAIPNDAWHDRELASYHAKQYIFHVTERRARSNLGNSRGSMTVRMRPLA